MDLQPRTSRYPSPAAAPLTGAHDPAPALVDPGVPGTVLGGRYRVGECLGAGAMGVVWSAFDRRLRRTVAVKQLVMRDRGAPDPTSIRAARVRALREGRIAARVVHPRAIAVFDVVEHDGTPWLVMEYLPSRSLAAVLAEQGPLEPEVVAHIGAQIAEALAAVHEAGIVHGDIKPGNVLITDDGVAKITDFGVSRATWDTTATGGDAVAGTPGFFAPEVARGDDPTPASDVFSLGATLYAAVENELVCGRLDNTLAVLHAMAEARLRPATRAGTLGRPLAAMLRREPEHRPEPAAVQRALRVRAATGRVRLAPAAARRPADDAGPSTAPGDAPASESAPLAAPSSSPPSSPASPDPSSPLPASVPHEESTVPAAALPQAIPAPRTSGTSGPATPEPAAPVGAVPAPRRARRGRTAFVVAAASVAVVAGASGVAIAALGSGPEPASPGLAAPAIVAPAPAPPTPGGAAPTAPSTASSTAPSAAPSSEPVAPDAPVGDDEAVRVVTDYYGGLPGDPDRAWAVLAGSARDDSGGYEGYRRFWDGITSATAFDVRADDGTVRADIAFVTREGRTSREQYRFRLGRDDDGRVVITSAQRSADAM